MGIVLGLENGAWLLGLGLLLIGMCHLPLPFSGRAIFLLLAGGVLAALRVDWLHAPVPAAVWPILGSMFMFRLMVYLYDLKYATAPVSIWRRLSYFFLLPNVCFPLFPVIDFKTFRRNYFDADPYRIYQVGVDWMARGVSQLLLYRLVYYYFTLAPSEVTGPGKLVQFLVSNFLLYLRVSGQFHFVIGMLHLFGFRLPETHHRYLLSSSFTDFWRRINIYWKDFMLKVFYYPIYFKIKGWGATRALLVSTLLVFFVTWFLHAYQWFWLRGSWVFSLQDAGFWAILALLVVANALYEAKHGRQRSLGGQRAFRWGSSLGLVLRTLGTFSVICVLWSLWTCESLSAWLALWPALGEVSASELRWLPPVFLGAAALAGMALLEARGDSRKLEQPKSLLQLSSVGTFASLSILALFGIPAVYTRLGVDAANVVHSLRFGKLNRLDTARLERGYYEDLLSVDRFNSQLWEVYINKPLPKLDVFQSSGLERFTGDFLQKQLIPSFTSVNAFGTISTNRWGMRDRDYEQRPSSRTYRIALLGSSTVMGWGVGDGETFEALVEDRLNREHSGKLYQKYQILNFAVPGYKPLQQRMALDKALTFEPKALFYAATGRETSQAALYLVEALRNKLDVPYPYLLELAKKAGIDSNTSETVAIRQLSPYRDQLLSWLYGEIVRASRDRGALPVWLFVPMVQAGAWQEENAGFFRIAKETGFIQIDLSDAYQGQDVKSLRLAEWDEHPNARGHQLLAARLYEELMKKDQALALEISGGKSNP